MSGVPLHLRGRSSLRLSSVGQTRLRQTVSTVRIARRRAFVVWSKRLLPVLALALLSSIALWPEFERQTDEARVAIRRVTEDVEGNGRVVNARYQSADQKGRPYTVTAAVAVQDGPRRVNLTAPKGDVTLQNGSWIMVHSKHGVYLQHTGQLDLSGDATLYRDDGTTLRSASVSVDLKSGAAASSDTVSAEGPFGTLDATGFTLVDKGAIVEFAGPARLILNQHKP